MSTLSLVVLLLVLGAATAFGLLRRARDGRIRQAGSGYPDGPDESTPGAARPDGWQLAGGRPSGDEQVLLLQLSSPVCAPCRQTAAVLGEWVTRTPGLAHREVDVAEDPGVAGALGVLRTPTVVAFDRAGHELLRVSGVPRLPELANALAPALPPEQAGR